MDPASIIADAMLVLKIGNLAIQAFQDAQPFINSAAQILSGTALTAQQRADMLAQESALTAQLNADSIPADQP